MARYRPAPLAVAGLCGLLVSTVDLAACCWLRAYSDIIEGKMQAGFYAKDLGALQTAGFWDEIGRFACFPFFLLGIFGVFLAVAVMGLAAALVLPHTEA